MRKRQIMAAANDEAIPCSESLGPKQKEAVDGPDWGPEMKNFTCTSCGNTFPDTRLYFYEIVSNRCLWCTKFPKERIGKR